MLGLTFEKLIVIAVFAALLFGPERLPHYAAKLADLVRALRAFTDTAKARATEQLGPEFEQTDWAKLDPRRYDPRRIIQEALAPEGPPLEGSPPVESLGGAEKSGETETARASESARASKTAPIRETTPVPGAAPSPGAAPLPEAASPTQAAPLPEAAPPPQPAFRRSSDGHLVRI